VFAFLALFAIPFVVDRSLSPVESIKASIATVRSNVGGSLLSWLVQIAAILVGELPCLVCLLVGFPLPPPPPASPPPHLSPPGALPPPLARPVSPPPQASRGPVLPAETAGFPARPSRRHTTWATARVATLFA